MSGFLIYHQNLEKNFLHWKNKEFIMENHNLKKIAETYKSDKIEHGYIEIYESYFHKLKEDNLIILELGIAYLKS